MLFFLDLLIILGGGAIIFLLLNKIKVPALIGYLLLGILINAIGAFDPNLAAISPYLRKIALIIILVKAGLSLDVADLKKVGRPAIMMSFMPAVVEMIVVGLVAPLFFDLTYVESFLLGSVLGAVSPAVVIPMMTRLMDEKVGTKKGIPQLVLAGSSIDDIVMIVFYQTFITIEAGGNVNAMAFVNILLSIVIGVVIGVCFGFLLKLIFGKVHMRDSIKLLLIIAIGIGFVALEEVISPYVGFSSLLATISMCIVIRMFRKEKATALSTKASKVWIPAEMFLFFLVGASIRLEHVPTYILPALAILIISLTARSLMVQGCLIKTDLNFKERSFVTISYLPKATVQASIGGGLLDLGNQMLANGNSRAEVVIAAGIIVLSVSALSILITAPLSSLVMNLSYKRLLNPCYIKR